jgi:ParB-like chromosome segregation protein Spo0J
VEHNSKLNVQYVSISELQPAAYNPRKWDAPAIEQLTESIRRFGLVDPIIVNGADNRKNVVIGGHFRLKVAKDMGYTEIPVVFVNIPDEQKEKELNLRLNKNLGDWDWDILADYDESILADIGFSSEELDDIFNTEDNPEVFNLEEELARLQIGQIEIQKGDGA